MSFGEVPVIDSTFSLPQDVFERVWAQSRQRVSNVPPPAASLHKTATSTQRYTTAVQSRRPSDDYVTDLTGNETKRHCVSLVSQQEFTHQMDHQKDKKEQLKLQMIMQRLNSTRDKVLKLLKLQKARALLNRYDNPAGRPAVVVKSQPRHVLLNRNISTPSIFHGTVQDRHSVSNLSSQSQRARLVPGINIVSNRTEQGTNEHSYDTLESAGLALDHQTLPKLVAVHSVVRDPSVAVNRCVTTDSHSLVGVATTAHKECVITSYPSVRTGLHESCHSAYVHKARDVRQFRTYPPLPGETTSRDGSLQNYENEEIILTKVIPGNKRVSTRTSPHVEKTQNVVDLAQCNEETEHDDKEQHSSGNKRKQSGLEHAMCPKNVDHFRTVDHPGNSGYPGYSNIPANVNHAEAVNHPGDVHRSEQEQHSGSLESANTDSEIYLGGPPPYLPVLSTFEMIEREKETSQQSSEKNPTSPRLSKTVPEISEKIVETRERIKNEIINWKKCLLMKVEKRLIQKLRRAEHLTGEKTEIEDLRQEVQERVTKRKRSKDERKDKTPSCQESVTGDVTGDAEDTLGSGGQQRRSSQEGGTESVTDDDGDNAVERRDTERTASREGGLTGVKVGGMHVAVEDHGGSVGSVTKSVNESDDNENTVECLRAEGTTSRQGSLSEEMTSDADDAAESHGQWTGSSHDCPTESLTSGLNCNKVECCRQEERNCGQEDNLMNSDVIKGHANLQKQEKMEELNDGQTESSQNKTEEKCKATQNVDTSRDEKVIVEHCENFTDVITEDREKSVIKLTKNEEARNNMEKQFNTSETQRNVKLEASERVDCVTTEHSQESVAPQLKRKSESLERRQPEFTGYGDVKKARNEKVAPEIQHSQDKKECVIPKGDKTEKIQAVSVGTDNIFDTFSSKVCVTGSIKVNPPNVPGVTIKAPATKKKMSGESNVALSMNTVSLKKKLQSCSKQALEAKAKTVDCERNIWSTLRKKGIF